MRILGELIIAGGLTAIGFLSGQGPLLALATSLAGEIGGNWASDLSKRGYDQWATRWLSHEGVLNHDIARALAGSLSAAVKQVMPELTQDERYRRLQAHAPQMTKTLLENLAALGDNASQLLQRSNRLAQLEEQDRLVSFMQGDETKIWAGLDQLVEGKFHGHETELVRVVQTRLVSAWLFHFKESVKEDPKAQWALERLWQTSLSESVRTLQFDVARVADMKATEEMEALSKMMDSLPASGLDIIGFRTLEQAVNRAVDQAHDVLLKRLDDIKQDTLLIPAVKEDTSLIPKILERVSGQQTFSEVDIQDQKNRRVLRHMVRKFWIEGVLAHSLNHEVAIRLNIADYSHLIENRLWKLIPKQFGETAKLLPSGTHITDVFDQMNQRLLILGEPGAGKTTLLLELADVLLKRADETPTEPSPVVFNLSSWIQRQLPLADWLVDELGIRHSIPKKLAQAWIERDNVLPLLDGLDEVKFEHRAACVQAINHFHENHLVPLVVCSRTTEYEQLIVPLKLQGAVLLQPLTPDQINVYLDRSGPSLETVRIALQHDTELQELARSPLILNIMTLAYQGVSTTELSLESATQTRRQHLFDTYIQRMFGRREVAPIYSAIQTVRWLQWLATRLMQSGQTVFLIERMQPSWLQSRQKQYAYNVVVLLVLGLLLGLAFGLILGLISGLVVGLAFGLLAMRRDIYLVVVEKWSWKKARQRLAAVSLLGLLFGLALGLIFGLISGLVVGLAFGLMGALTFGLFILLLGGLVRNVEIDIPQFSNQGIQLSLRTAIRFGLTFSLAFGLTGALVNELVGVLAFGLSDRLVNGLSDRLAIGLVNWLPIGLVVGLYAGGEACIKHLILRLLLFVNGHIPWDYARFLDYATALIFLRKVGGGYIFVHRLVMDHFAAMTDEDMDQLVKEVK